MNQPNDSQPKPVDPRQARINQYKATSKGHKEAVESILSKVEEWKLRYVRPPTVSSLSTPESFWFARLFEAIRRFLKRVTSWGRR